MKVEIKPRKTYIVKHGDTATTLAKKFGVDSYNILSLNNVEEIEEGDEILVPYLSSSFYVVKPADTLYTISKKLGCDMKRIVEKNGDTLFIGKKIYY